MNLLSVEKLVENALVDYPETRSDDFQLVYRVYEQLHPHIRICKI